MDGYDKTAAILKALAHPVRLKILELLTGEGEACVCHLEARLDLRQAYISQQLAKLREVGLVEDRRDGLNVFYSVSNVETAPLLEAAKDLAAAVGRTRNEVLLFHVTGPVAPAMCSCPSCEEKLARSTTNSEMPLPEQI